MCVGSMFVALHQNDEIGITGPRIEPRTQLRQLHVLDLIEDRHGNIFTLVPPVDGENRYRLIAEKSIVLDPRTIERELWEEI